MSKCPSYLKVAPGVVTWSVYSETCKTDCFGHAISHQDKLILIDPILPATAEIWNKIMKLGQPNLIILTNGNHERHAHKVAREYDIPIAGGIHSISGLSQKPDVYLDGQATLQGLRPVSCPGGGPGETALFSESTRTLILGDSVINLPTTGLQLLPDKYCSDPARLKVSLTALLDLPFKNLLMAHGIPITNSPKTKLKALLESTA